MDYGFFTTLDNYSPSDFDAKTDRGATLQHVFRVTIANLTSVSIDNVVIMNVTDGSRRAGVTIQCTVYCPAVAAAALPSEMMDTTPSGFSQNFALEAAAEGVAVSAPVISEYYIVEESGSSSHSARSTGGGGDDDHTLLVVTIIMILVACSCCVICTFFWYRNFLSEKKARSKEKDVFSDAETAMVVLNPGFLKPSACAESTWASQAANGFDASTSRTMSILQAAIGATGSSIDDDLYSVSEDVLDVLNEPVRPDSRNCPGDSSGTGLVAGATEMQKQDTSPTGPSLPQIHVLDLDSKEDSEPTSQQTVQEQLAQLYKTKQQHIDVQEYSQAVKVKRAIEALEAEHGLAEQEAESETRKAKSTAPSTLGARIRRKAGSEYKNNTAVDKSVLPPHKAIEISTSVSPESPTHTAIDISNPSNNTLLSTSVSPGSPAHTAIDISNPSNNTLLSTSVSPGSPTHTAIDISNPSNNALLSTSRGSSTNRGSTSLSPVPSAEKPKSKTPKAAAPDEVELNELENWLVSQEFNKPPCAIDITNPSNNPLLSTRHVVDVAELEDVRTAANRTKELKDVRAAANRTKELKDVRTAANRTKELKGQRSAATKLLQQRRKSVSPQSHGLSQDSESAIVEM